MVSDGSLEKFNADVDAAYNKKVVQGFLEFHRAVSLDAFKKVSSDSRDVGLQFGSPVWSGWFRSGHNISIGAPDLTPPEPNPDAEGVRWPDEPDSILPAPALSQAAQVLLALNPFSIVYIANAAPHARRLEGGWSKLKAPEGVYKITAMAVIGKYKQIAAQVGRFIQGRLGR